MIHEIRLDPEEDVVDGRALDLLLERWLEDRATKVDPVTVVGYRKKLLIFRRWWQATGPSKNWCLTRSVLLSFEVEFRSFTHHRTGAPLSYNTRRDVLRRLRSALKWAFDTNRLEINCCVWVPSPFGEEPQRIAPGVEQLKHLMECADGKWGVRDQAILAMFIGTGVRRTECSSLDVEGITFRENGAALATVRGKRTKVNKTGNREIVIDNVTASYLARHIVEAGYVRGPVFQNARGERLSSSGVYKRVRLAVERAGLGDAMQACHDLRRAFTTHFTRLRPGAAYADILRRQLGHANYRQTTVYNLMQAEDLLPHIISPLSGEWDRPV